MSGSWGGQAQDEVDDARVALKYGVEAAVVSLLEEEENTQAQADADLLADPSEPSAIGQLEGVEDVQQLVDELTEALLGEAEKGRQDRCRLRVRRYRSNHKWDL